ncbi:MAG: glycosyltransferase family 4 protein [Xanthomonadales bacterium]|nr:glycosyltransferase family 4 protein [Xanthomonadales bacterium]
MARAWADQPEQEIRDGVQVLRQGGFDQSRFIYWDLLRDFYDGWFTRRRIPSAEVTVFNDLALPMLVGNRRELGALVVSLNRYPKGQFRFYRHVDLVTCGSRFVADGVTSQAPDFEDRVAVVPSAFEVDDFRASPDIPRQRQRILFAGRVHPEKGLETLITAFRKIHRQRPESSLAILGPWEPRQGGGGESYLSGLRGLARDLPVEFLPPRFDISELALAYAEAGVFCLPSIAEQGECLPVAPLEAMAAGCPVVVSNLSCFRDYAEDRRNMLVFDHRAGDADTRLAACIGDIMDSPDLAGALASAGLETAERYSLENISAVYLDHFERLLESRGSI